MKFPVTVQPAKAGKQPKRRSVVCEFARADDVNQLKSWGGQLPGGLPEEIKNKMLDSAEYAVLAADKWKFLNGQPTTRVIHSLDELKSLAGSAREQDELAGLLIARASWNNPTALLGFCFFRRTWCNNIIIDFLATHPLVAGHEQIRGVGRGLVYSTTTLAKEIGAKFVWGESTNSSCTIYQSWFHQPKKDDDLFRIHEPALEQFRADTENKWGPTGKKQPSSP